MQAEEILAVLLNKIKNSGSGGSGNVPTKVSELENDEGYITAATMPVNTSTVSGAVLAGAEYPDKMWGTDNEGNPKWMQPKEFTATWEDRTLDDFYGEKCGEVKICSVQIGPSNDSVFGKEPFTDFKTGICISIHNSDNDSIEQIIIQIEKSTSLYSRTKIGTWTEWKKTDAVMDDEYLPLSGGTMKIDSSIRMPANNGISGGIYLSSSVDDYTMNIHPGELSLRHNSKNTIVSSADINTPVLTVGETLTVGNSEAFTTMLPNKIKTNTKHFEVIVDSDSDGGLVAEVKKKFLETTLELYGKNVNYTKLGTPTNPLYSLYLSGNSGIDARIFIDDTGNGYSATIYPAYITFYRDGKRTEISTDTSTFAGNVIPSDGETLNLGSSSYKWKNIYATNGTIQTSDRNEKNTIEELPVKKAQQLIYGLKPSTYKMNAGTSGRTHWGMISQDIEELFDEIGMTSLDFAGFIKSPKTRRITEDENGERLVEPVEEIIEGEYDYSLRYDEFIAPIIKVIQSQREEIELLSEKNKTLEQRIDLLEQQALQR